MKVSSVPKMLLSLLLAIVFGCATLTAFALTEAAELPGAIADKWISDPVQYPAGFADRVSNSNLFANLRAEVLAERLKILWSPQAPLGNATVTLYASADEPGHWPARDWRPFRMNLRGNNWETLVPVDNVDVPLVYFVAAAHPGAPAISPMRICKPALAGLETPTRIFWPFLEGFEQDTASWRLLSDPAESTPLQTDTNAMSGRASLAVPVPAGKRSVTIASTRVRGWQLVHNGATGLRIGLRTRQGAGRARFTLLADAFTTNQVISVCGKEPLLKDAWQTVDILFKDLPKLPLANVDLLAIEFIGGGPLEFLVDDLQLLGPWKVELQ